MIIVRSPLRISLGGGGTDLPSYYRQQGGGFLVAAAIDKYVYITLHETFQPEIIVKYSKMEHVESVDEVQHPIVREVMKLVGIDGDPHLGSSGSFTTALLKALHAYRKNLVHPAELAAQACEIELERLHEPIGKQDQYIAAYGGVTCLRFCPDDRVEAWPVRMSIETLHNLEDNLLLYFTNFTRSASALLKEQDEKSKGCDQTMLDNLNAVRQLGFESQAALEKGDLNRFAELMNIQWHQKRCRSKGMSNDTIDELYEIALKNGATGGKLIGAGGGGFLLFYAENHTRLRRAMADCGLREVRFRFDYVGTKILAQ